MIETHPPSCTILKGKRPTLLTLIHNCKKTHTSTEVMAKIESKTNFHKKGGVLHALPYNM
jgi:hypothetical protein